MPANVLASNAQIWMYLSRGDAEFTKHLAIHYTLIPQIANITQHIDIWLRQVVYLELILRSRDDAAAIENLVPRQLCTSS